MIAGRPGYDCISMVFNVRLPELFTVSAINRNYTGRSGPGRLYLASPLTVAASAIAGRIVAYKPGMFAEPATV